MSVVLHSPFGLFLIQALVIIAVARLVSLAGRWLGQPMVMSEIVAGVMLGPSLLGWVWPEMSASLFPAESMAILKAVSQLGLVLFMFLVGLELDVRLLRGRGRASVAISQASMVLPFGLGAALAVHLHSELAPPDVPLGSFALFMGVAMSTTAFPVLARILTEQRLLRSRVGSLAVACAAVDDVLVWCVLAVVMSVLRASGVAVVLQTSVGAVAFVLTMLLAVRPFMRRLAERARSGDGLPQDAVALTFLLLLGASAATHAIGVHALFGAFLFGAIIPREQGFAHALAEKLEDLVVVVLTPLFFAYSGLRTQAGLLDSASAWMTCGLVLLVACAGKLGASTAAARASGLGWREASAVGVLLNTRGPMELVILNIGLDLGLLSPSLFTMMVLMALITTAMTAPLLRRLCPPAALTPDDGPEPSASPGAAVASVPRVLVCLSQPRAQTDLIPLVHALGGAAPTQRRVFALQLLEPAERPSAFVVDEEATPLDPLERWAAQAAEQGLAVSPISFVSSRPAEDICSVAEAKRAELIVISAHRPLLWPGSMGRTVQSVLANASADVAVLLRRNPGPLRRALLAVTGSEHDAAALHLAEQMAAVLEVRTIIPDGIHRPAGCRLPLLPQAPGVPLDDAIAQASDGQDLLVLGWEDGRVPSAVLERTSASVLLVRGGARWRVENQAPQPAVLPSLRGLMAGGK